MAKYINADDIEYMKRTFCYGHGWYEDEEYVLKEKIDEMPAADVRENVRGEWIYKDGKVRCSKCFSPHDVVYDSENNFCPNCGADMRG